MTRASGGKSRPQNYEGGVGFCRSVVEKEREFVRKVAKCYYSVRHSPHEGRACSQFLGFTLIYQFNAIQSNKCHGYGSATDQTTTHEEEEHTIDPPTANPSHCMHTVTTPHIYIDTYTHT